MFGAAVSRGAHCTRCNWLVVGRRNQPCVTVSRVVNSHTSSMHALSLLSDKARRQRSRQKRGAPPKPKAGLCLLTSLNEIGPGAVGLSS